MRRDPINYRPPKTSAISIVSATKSGSTVTITFNQAVLPPKGGIVPQYTLTGAAVTPMSVAMTSPTTVEVTFSGVVTAATDINIPYEEPAIRNAIGGFVAQSTFPVT
jgi:hypothetical protein